MAQAGLGGGIITTTLLTTATGMDQHSVVATSIVALVPTGLAASFQNLRNGNVHMRAAIVLGVSCAAAMAFTATYVAHQVPESTMRYLFAGFLVLSSARMMIKP